jgi:hypothetical protein
LRGLGSAEPDNGLTARNPEIVKIEKYKNED